jgi:dihydrolipoamide dehydrogenase
VHDLIVVGGGPGGYASALYAHNFGLSVAIVSNEDFGGTCLLRGCIPAKQWLHVADVFTTVRHASDFGVFVGEPEMDWQTALAKKNEVVEITVKGVTGLLKQRNTTMVRGQGRLDGPGRVIVSGEDGDSLLEGRAVVMATGSYPRTIPGYEIDGERIVTSDHALDWAVRPDRVAIVGGGVIGCEFASLLTDLGAEVHVFEVMDQIVPGSDPDGAKMLQRQLSRRGVKFHIGVGVDAPQVGADGVVVPFGDHRIEVDVVLVSVGRGPNTSGVGFESTRAEVDRGFVKVDLDTMQTDEPGLYAVGDIVAGTPQLAHVGFAEAITAVTHIATGRSEPVDYRAIPRVTYTHPEMAEVGLTEQQAAEAGYEVETHTHYFNGVARARIIGEAQGIVKVISQKDGPILGASVVGPQAGEMIHELMYAVGWEALPSEAAAFIHAHPTLSEGIGETLLAAAGRSLH